MKKVLIVDDSIVIRNSLKSILKEFGYEIVGEACNGQEGIDKYRELKPDLIFLDITMPVMNGIEVIDNIMELENDVKIIIVSAISQRMIVREAILKGATNYIVKPVNKEKIKEVLSNI